MRMDNNKYTEYDTHDYKDTIAQAAELDGGSERAERIAQERADDLNYEAFAVASAMGMLGMEETNASLLQLELAQELMVQMDEDDEDEFHIGD